MDVTAFSISSHNSSSNDFLQQNQSKCTTKHSSLSAVMHAPFHVSMLRPASQAGPMHETAGVGKLVNAALLSLINESCVNVCCATILSTELVGPACVQARSSNPRGRECRPSDKGSGEEGILSDVVPYEAQYATCK